MQAAASERGRSQGRATFAFLDGCLENARKQLFRQRKQRLGLARHRLGSLRVARELAAASTRLGRSVYAVRREVSIPSLELARPVERTWLVKLLEQKASNVTLSCTKRAPQASELT